MTTAHTRTTGALAVISIATLMAQAGGSTVSWLNPVDGSWNLGTNWDTGVVPASNNNVLLGLSGAYTVTSGGTMDCRALMISNPDAVLHIDSSRTLNLYNNLDNDGTIIVNPFNGGNTTQFDFESSAVITGSGEIRLGGSGTRARIRTGVGDVVTQSAGHSIRGFGQVEGVLINNGLVEADVTGQILNLNTAPKTNNALFQASNGAVLKVSSIIIDQGGGGSQSVVGAGSLLDLSGSTIIGGTMSTDADGLINADNCTLDGVNFSGGNLEVRSARTLNIYNSITNDGVMTVNPTNGGSATQLDFETDGSFLGSGEVVLAGAGTRARLRTGDGFTMTNSATHTIHGFGQIESLFVNDGLVSADIPAQTLTLNANDKVNNATMQSISGAILNVVGISVDQTGGGELVADGVGSKLLLTNATVFGGTVISRNGASASVTTATLHGVTHEGLLDIPSARTLNVFDSITNNGVITINPINGGSATQLDFENDGSFLGSGEVVLGGSGSRARLRTAPGVTMTNTPTHTIHGFGTIEATLVNDGLVQADVLSQELGLLSNTKVNNATMQAIAGGILDFSNITVEQSGSGQLLADGAGSRIDFNSTTIVGGTIETMNGGSVQVVSATYDAVTSNAETTLPSGRTLDVRNGTVNNGTIQVNPINGGSTTSIRWADDSQIGGNGTIALLGTGSRARLNLLGAATIATLGQGQRLEGIGSIDAPLMHHGTTAPGMSIGKLVATRAITYSDTSVFEAEVSATDADLLDCTMSVQLDGTLNVLFTDGFAPTGFWAHTIIEGSSITGKFDALNIPAPPSGLVTRIINTGTEVRVGQTCPGDANLDGMVNFFDVSKFLADFADMSPEADLNNDNQWNFFDVSVFLSNFSLGC